MDSYIIRIYRYEKDRPQRLVGTVEKAGEEGKKAFTHVEELYTILSNADRLLKKRKKKDDEKR